jgi:methylmalonyl-CoA mutase N-terminal domain/subunit
VNAFVEDESDVKIETHPYDIATAERQISRTKRVRVERDQTKIDALLVELVEVAKDDGTNIMPVTVELVREGATMGDIIETLKEVWGTYRETPVF